MKNFEEWASAAGYDLRKIDGVYISPMTQSALEGWKAADDVYKDTIKLPVEQLNGAIDT